MVIMMSNLRETRSQKRMELQIQATVNDETPRYCWAQLVSLVNQHLGESNPPETIRDWRVRLGIHPDKPTRNGRYTRRDLVWLKGWGLWRRSYTGTTFANYVDWLLGIVERVENEQGFSENITEIEVVANECE